MRQIKRRTSSSNVSIPQHLDYKITFRCDANLLNQIKKEIQSLHAKQDYTYLNVSDVIRRALQAYQKGMNFKIKREMLNPRRETSLKVTHDLFSYYCSLPAGLRVGILESALLTYCQEKLFVK